MTFDFSPTFAQAFRASLWVAFRNPFVWPAIIFFPGCGVAVLSTLPGGHLPLWITLLEILLVLWCFAFVPAMVAFNVWQARRSNRTTSGVHRYTFTEEGIQLSGPLFETRLAWAAVLRSRESREFFFVNISRQVAPFLPVSAVAASGQLPALRSLLGSKLSERARFRAGAAA